ncbi:MAG: aminoacyl-tRNA hydrolase [Chloroflexi bacterium]|nr:aminoacyl-tRNA hydrolase [Chloroflexota bacterium]
MIEVTPSVKIEESEIQYDFIRVSGPGGQNVNKVASSVQLRFDIRNSPSLEPDVKERLIKLAGSRVTEDGILIIEAKRYRTQDQNRFDANQRLISLIQKALEKPKVRRATRPIQPQLAAC